MSQEHQMKISNIKPFGPQIMKVELSDNILKKMIDDKHTRIEVKSYLERKLNEIRTV